MFSCAKRTAGRGRSSGVGPSSGSWHRRHRPVGDLRRDERGKDRVRRLDSVQSCAARPAKGNRARPDRVARRVQHGRYALGKRRSERDDFA